MRRLAIALALAISCSGVAMAEELAVCGASQGHAYYPMAGLLAQSGSKDGGKWHPDSISQGKFTLTRQGDTYDILFADASGAIVSSTADGGSVFLIGRNSEASAFVVNYPGATVETFMFIKSENGPEVVWSQNKYGSPILKVAAFRAPCSFVNLE